jgi:NTP pyrophosphatase (non-canonical NTP hydrolase)
MTFEEYQNKAKQTAIYPEQGNNFVYIALGLAGEGGEIADKVKKILRDKNGAMDEESKKEMCYELGDILWYVSQMGIELGLSLEEIAEKNLEKIFSRKERGAIGGSGDER